MLSTRALIASVLILTLSSGCGMAYGQDSDKKAGAGVVITLTQVDKDKSVEAHPGDEIVVSLAENPGTGYQWAIAQSDEHILALEETRYVPDPTGGRVGGGGQRLFSFQAQKAGTVSLRLDLWRPWEGEKSVVDRFAVLIDVHE